MANFGWSLSDSINPFRTGLTNFRTNLMQRREDVPPPVPPPPASEERGIWQRSCHTSRRKETGKSKSAFSAIQQWASNDSVFTSNLTARGKTSRQASLCSDSCIGSDYPSLTSTGSSDSECATECELRMTSRETAIRSRATSLASNTSSVDVWRGSLHHALVVMEDREEEMSSLFDQLHEIQADLSQMTDQVGQVTHSLQRVQRRRNAPSVARQRHSRTSAAAAATAVSTAALSLTEDEMADVVHRLLTQICELHLARQQGQNDVPLIV